MPVPVDSDAISFPVQLGTFVGIFLAVLVPAVRAFLSAYRSPDRSSEHVVLESAELADLRDIRLLAQQMRAALEKIDEIYDRTERMERTLNHTDDVMDRMERAAELARGLREALAERDRKGRD